MRLLDPGSGVIIDQQPENDVENDVIEGKKVERRIIL